MIHACPKSPESKVAEYGAVSVCRATFRVFLHPRQYLPTPTREEIPVDEGTLWTPPGTVCGLIALILFTVLVSIITTTLWGSVVETIIARSTPTCYEVWDPMPQGLSPLTTLHERPVGRVLVGVS